MPVELPGSLPMDRRQYASMHQSLDGKAGYGFASPNAYAANIFTPRSSPQEETHSLINMGEIPRPSNLQQPLPSTSTRSKSTPPHQTAAVSLGSCCSEDAFPGPDVNQVATITRRPPLSKIHDGRANLAGLSVSAPATRAATEDTLVRPGSSHNGVTCSQSDEQLLLDSEVMIEQIAGLRASHDAHLKSLREAHEKEIASHRSYITFLEARRGLLPPLGRPQSKGALSLDTSNASIHADGPLGSESSATTLHSFDSSLDNRHKVSLDAATDLEALKRELNSFRKAQVDVVKVHRECDQLRELKEGSDRKVLQLKDTIHRAKENEKTLKNANGDLEARLVAANNERTDVQEGFHEACAQVRGLTANERLLSQEIDELRSRAFYAQTVASADVLAPTTETSDSSRPSHHRTRSELVPTATRGGSLLQQVHDLQRVLAQKSVRIQELEHKISDEQIDARSTTDKLSVQTSKALELQGSLEQHKNMLAGVQTEANQYKSLLHSELRRQASSAVDREHPARPKIEAEAFVVATKQMIRLKAQAGALSSSDSREKSVADADPDRLAVALERELEYCIKEILMYK